MDNDHQPGARPGTGQTKTKNMKVSPTTARKYAESQTDLGGLGQIRLAKSISINEDGLQYLPDPITQLVSDAVLDAENWEEVVSNLEYAVHQIKSAINIAKEYSI